MVNGLRAYFTRSGLGGSGRAPAEVIALRSLGLVYLTLFIVATVTTRPYPALHGRGLAVLLAGIAMVVAAVAVAPPRDDIPASRRIA